MHNNLLTQTQQIENRLSNIKTFDEFINVLQNFKTKDEQNILGCVLKEHSKIKKALTAICKQEAEKTSFKDVHSRITDSTETYEMHNKYALEGNLNIMLPLQVEINNKYKKLLEAEPVIKKYEAIVEVFEQEIKDINQRTYVNQRENNKTLRYAVQQTIPGLFKKAGIDTMSLEDKKNFCLELQTNSGKHIKNALTYSNLKLINPSTSTGLVSSILINPSLLDIQMLEKGNAKAIPDLTSPLSFSTPITLSDEVKRGIVSTVFKNLENLKTSEEKEKMWNRMKTTSIGREVLTVVTLQQKDKINNEVKKDKSLIETFKKIAKQLIGKQREVQKEPVIS